MGLFSKFFRKNASDTFLTQGTRPVPTATAHPPGIQYDPGLINTLLRDHAELGQLYQSIGKAGENRDHVELGRLLGRFKLRLEAHVIHENVRFYNYVEQSMKNDPASLDLMRGFRRNMNAIVREVLDFVSKYQSADTSPEVYRDFRADHARVLHALELRLDSEESSLYPLYKPH